MYNYSFYFPRLNLFTQPPSIFLKSEDADEERLLIEAEIALDRMEALIKSNASDQLLSSPGHLSRLGRASADSQMSNNQMSGTQQSGTQIRSFSPSYSSPGSSLSEMDTGTSIQQSPVKPLQPLKKPWSLAKKAVVSLLTAGGTFIVYNMVVKAPTYDGSEVDLQGKTIVVTEASNRMSRNLLRELAQRKATLILATKSMDDCEDTRYRLMRSVPGIEETHIDCRRLDLDSTRSIRRFAGSLLADYPNGIDRLLIHPPSVLTGVIAGDRRLTHDAFEHQLGTNFFSFYLLSRLLTPAMQGLNRDARIIFTIDTRAAGFAESVADKDPNTGSPLLPINNWNWNEGYTPSAGYQRAQWALYLFADELAKRTAENGPTVLIADLLVNRTSPPEVNKTENGWLSAPYRWLRNFGRGYLTLGYIITRIVPQRVTPTEVMCTVATRDSLDLPQSGGSTTPNDQTVPVYADLKREKPPGSVDRSEAENLLWLLAEKWTKLDTYPNPVPLPPKF
nr:short chain dehydrogenase:reductase sdr,short chain dehydrogenase:reductase (sdr),retinol dehydrogenase [Hymenolepis microstoma]